MIITRQYCAAVPCAWSTLCQHFCAPGERQCCLLASIIIARKRGVRKMLERHVILECYKRGHFTHTAYVGLVRSRTRMVLRFVGFHTIRVNDFLCSIL